MGTDCENIFNAFYKGSFYVNHIYSAKCPHYNTKDTFNGFAGFLNDYIPNEAIEIKHETRF